MAGTGRIYRRGAIYYIAYRWDGREYRESARSSEVADAERLLATAWPNGVRARGRARLTTSPHGISRTTPCGGCAG